MIKSVCGYCGVGCGIEYDEKKLVGDLAYPSNEGQVCSKGVSELYTIQTTTRLLRPKFRECINDEFKTIKWDMAIEHIANRIKNTPSKKVAFYLSGQLLTEDYYIANKLAKGFIKTNNIDTNSRTCMSSAVVAYQKAFGVDYVPVEINDIKKANLIILVGSNASESHVVFFNKIKKELKRGLKLIVIDPRLTETAKSASLYLPINPGSDIDFFNLISQRLIEENKIDEEFIKNHTNNYTTYFNKLKRAPKTKMLKRTGLSKEQFEEFMEMFLESENIISAWTMGINQSVQGVDKNQAIINLHLISGKINKEGNGPFSLTGQPNAMGGREVGSFANMLAVHLDFEKEAIKKVEEFWKTKDINPHIGLTALEIVEEALKGNIEVLLICHTDPIYHLPNREKVERALKKIPLVIDINAYDDSETSSFAHIKLPAAPWGEKEGTQTNMDRTISRQEKLSKKSIDCKADWEIFKLLAISLGFKDSFNYLKTSDIFEEYKQMTRLSKDGHLNIYEMEKNQFIWGKGLFKENQFFTKNKKANFIYVENKRMSLNPDKEFSFLLLTGRIKDQWHSGTKTHHVNMLYKNSDLEFVEINTFDAKELDINSGDFIDVETNFGKLCLEAKVTNNIKEKTLFIPVTTRKINYLTNDLYDKESKQPDYNHTPAKIAKAFSLSLS